MDIRTNAKDPAYHRDLVLCLTIVSQEKFVDMGIKTKGPRFTEGLFSCLEIGAGRGIRTHTPAKVADFKSAASTIPPSRPFKLGLHRLNPHGNWFLGEVGGGGTYSKVEATGGFEPPNRGFADLRLNHLATSPRCSVRPVFPTRFYYSGAEGGI